MTYNVSMGTLNPTIPYYTIPKNWGDQYIVLVRTVEDELISALPLSTHSAIEMLHDSALYKFMIDIDIVGPST